MTNWYKQTTHNMQTYNGFQWELGKWVETNGEGPLCDSGWIHICRCPILLSFLMPGLVVHDATRTFRCQVDGTLLHDGTFKSGATRVRLVEEIETPQLTLVQRQAFGILSAQAVACSSKAWNKWAANWLLGKNRTAWAAARAEEAAWAEAAEAARAAAGELDFPQIAAKALTY